MKLTTVFLALFCFVSVTYAAGCTQQTFWNNIEYKILIRKLSSHIFQDLKLETLKIETANATYGFSSPQVVGILQTFNSTSGKTQALSILAHRNLVLGLYCKDVVSALGTVSKDKLQMFTALINFTIDFQNNQSVVDAFTSTSDKQKVLSLFDNSNPYSCVWGSLDIPAFDYIIDTSASMSTNFTNPDGTVVTRLQYVQQQLYISLASLKPSQQFNLIAFANTAVQWQHGVVFATPENIRRAYSWIASLSAAGESYMSKAFQLAFKDPKVLAINLLSDRFPSEPTSTIMGLVSSWSQGANPRRHVNAISFQPGGTYDTYADSFLQGISNLTGGVSRSIV